MFNTYFESSFNNFTVEITALVPLASSLVELGTIPSDPTPFRIELDWPRMLVALSTSSLRNKEMAIKYSLHIALIRQHGFDTRWTRPND